MNIEQWFWTVFITMYGIAAIGMFVMLFTGNLSMSGK